jgi:hypothetical protein
VNAGDSVGDPIFSDIGFFSGIAETDWSWTPMVQDFNNDGFRDIIITNGYPKDVTDRDFIAFRKESFSIASKEFTLKQIPQVKLHNYAFQNNGNLTFDNVTEQWGIIEPSFSNGAVYADLDNDGDLDVVINNINETASVYENTLMGKKDFEQHFLTVQLIGDSKNRNGFGAWVELFYNSSRQVYEQSPYRGYLSTVQVNPHFGFGAVSKIDSLIVKWPNGMKQVLQDVRVDQTIKVDVRNAKQSYSWHQPVLAWNTLFTDVSHSLNINYQHKEKDFVDFNVQKLLPHKFSEYGPAVAAGDIDGNGLDDMICGGSTNYSPIALLQQKNGTFIQKLVLPNADSYNKLSDDMGITLFDADGDGDLDLYIARGGYENSPGSDTYADLFMINDGQGNFTTDSVSLPKNYTSKSCVRAADYDKDGDLDLFVAGRVEPWNYPKPVSSFIYRNDSKGGSIKFTDVTAAVAKSLHKVGLVCDAVWTDFDNDGWQDLVVTGEWMPVKFLKNEMGVLKDISATSNINDKIGWWTSIVPGDFDNDGDMDYIAGNLGLNSFYKASSQYPVHIYAKDFDNNGNYDAIPTLFLPTAQKDTSKAEYPVHTRDDMIKQLISFRAKFQKYETYATAPFSKMFTEEEMKGVLKLQANYFSNSYIKNNGNGTFTLSPLPQASQYACLNGMLAEDFDGDGNLDVLAVGNDYGTEVFVGRYDACNGLFLKGDGKGNFSKTSILQSGWFVPGNAKALVKLKSSNDKSLVIASQNKDKLKVYELKRKGTYVPVQTSDASAMVYYKNGTRQKRELNYGASFLSQSGRFLNVDSTVQKVVINDYEGNSRILTY